MHEFSTDIHVSLMAQYCPTPHTIGVPYLNRPVFEDEYAVVVGELESKDHFRPDFDQNDPFEAH